MEELIQKELDKAFRQYPTIEFEEVVPPTLPYAIRQWHGNDTMCHMESCEQHEKDWNPHGICEGKKVKIILLKDGIKEMVFHHCYGYGEPLESNLNYWGPTDVE